MISIFLETSVPFNRNDSQCLLELWLGVIVIGLFKQQEQIPFIEVTHTTQQLARSFSHSCPQAIFDQEARGTVFYYQSPLGTIPCEVKYEKHSKPLSNSEREHAFPEPQQYIGGHSRVSRKHFLKVNIEVTQYTNPLLYVFLNKCCRWLF